MKGIYNEYLARGIKCLKCNTEIIFSYGMSGEGYTFCTCRLVAADRYGGRLGFTSNYKEIHIGDNGSFLLRREHLCWSSVLNKLNKFRKKPINISIKNLTTSHIRNILETQRSMNPIYRDTMEKELIYRKYLGKLF